MYIDSATSQGKYTRHLLRENYREGNKVKHRTIANLSHCSPQEIEAMKLALKHKNDLTALASLSDDVTLQQGLSVGAVWLVYDMAKQLGIVDALGPGQEGKRALWQVIARVIDQGSRLSAVRLAGKHAACDILGLDAFDEDDLYANLDWLNEHQAAIEDRLFKSKHGTSVPNLFLYDVTSCYLEGECNALSDFGYNRDKKQGKRQIVIGLLCDEQGTPLSIEVFPGNTRDPQTLGSQIQTVADRFGGKEVTFVGDRGMIKSGQVKELLGEQFHYITAITKPQINKMLKQGKIQMSLFDQELAEIEEEETRFILRRNPFRAEEIKANRESKLASLKREIERQNQYLEDHRRARQEVALRKVQDRSKKLKIDSWLKITVADRKITLEVDEEELQEASKLDGCYVLKTDLRNEDVDKETIHARYKDLALVEWAFRMSKTVHLEARPVYVRRESRTRGHVFVVMLAYLIIQELAKRWQGIDMTVEEGIKELTTLCAVDVVVNGTSHCSKIPDPRPEGKRLFEDAEVRLPQVLPCRNVRVATRKKLPENRKNR